LKKNPDKIGVLRGISKSISTVTPQVNNSKKIVLKAHLIYLIAPLKNHRIRLLLLPYLNVALERLLVAATALATSTICPPELEQLKNQINKANIFASI